MDRGASTAQVATLELVVFSVQVQRMPVVKVTADVTKRPPQPLRNRD